MENDILSLNKAKFISANLEIYNWIKISRIKWIEVASERKNKAVKKYKDDMIKISSDYAIFELEFAEYLKQVRNLARQLQSAIIKNYNSLDTLIFYSDELYELKKYLKILYAKHHAIFIQIQRLTDRVAKKKKPSYNIYEIEDEFKIEKDSDRKNLKEEEELEGEDKPDPEDEEGGEDDEDDGEGDGENEAEAEIQVLDDTAGGELITKTINQDQPDSSNIKTDQPETSAVEPQKLIENYDDDDEDVKPKKKKKKKAGGKKASLVLKAFSNLFGKSNANVGMKPVSNILTEAGISLGTINKLKFTCLNDFMLGVELVKNALKCDIRYLESLSVDLQNVYRNNHSYEYVKKCNLEDMIYRCSGEIIENIFKLELACTRYLMEY